MASSKGYPQNELLWNNLMRQAKAKYPIKNPKAKTSFPINEWVEKQYSMQGGAYGPKRPTDPKMIDQKTRDEKKKKAKIAWFPPNLDTAIFA